jgi:hypothetical protein
MRPGSDVDIIADPIVVICAAAGVENAALTKMCAGIDHHTSANHRARPNGHPGANDRGGMDSRGKLGLLGL